MQNKPEYPTRNELKEALEAHKAGGSALLDFLRKQGEKREQEKNPSTK